MTMRLPDQGRAAVLHVGCAAGFSGDRTDAASAVVDALAGSGGPGVLVFETLAERTLALAQLARRDDPSGGYEPLLDDLLNPVLARCLDHGIRIVGNFGAANPWGAARRILALAAAQGLRSPRVAVVEGDDLIADPLLMATLRAAQNDATQDTPVVSANAYIGAQSIAAALIDGADVVVCGRVADPSLVLGPAVAHFGWSWDDWDRLAGATMAGHLLECGAQVTGGYYADPGFKDVPGMATLGYPIAELHEDGSCVITKPPGTGGMVDGHTVKEQLLYELHDPAAYLTPDVVADITQAHVLGLGPDRVRLHGVRGHPRPEHLKVLIGRESGWLAEGEISYAGPRARERAWLAAQVLRERLPNLVPLRVDLIGVLSVWGDDPGQAWKMGWTRRFVRNEIRSDFRDANDGGLDDVRLRVAARHPDRQEAQRLAREVTALYTCGPAGGGGVRTSLRPSLSTSDLLWPRERVVTRHAMVTA